MKVLITGANGLVGSNLTTYLRVMNHTVVPCSRQDLDVTEFTQCLRTLYDHNPDFVVHCAAFTSVDGAEAEPLTASCTNNYGTANIADTCSKIGIPVLYLSTDAVFDGTAVQPMQPLERTAPLSVYGTTKLAGENEIRRRISKHTILRTIWIYGPQRSNFITQAAEKFKAAKPNQVVDFPIVEQLATPTNVLDLCVAIERLMVGQCYGTFHFTNDGETSRSGVIEFLSQYFNRKYTLSNYKARAVRPYYCLFDKTNIKNAISMTHRTWEEALTDFVETHYGR